MNMMKKLLLTVVAVSAVASMSVTAFAHCGGGYGGCRGYYNYNYNYNYNRPSAQAQSAQLPTASPYCAGAEYCDGLHDGYCSYYGTYCQGGNCAYHTNHSHYWNY